MDKINDKYNELKDRKSDINQHLPTVKRYAEQCDHITEFGVRKIVSTWALLAGNPKRMISVDIKHPNKFGGNIDEVIDAVIGIIDYEFKIEDTTKNDIEETDLLFIDTWHHYEQLKSEFRHATKVRKYIILHDTTTFGIKGENGKEGLKKAIDEFLGENKDWCIKEIFRNNNGLTVLGRVVQNTNINKMQFIIPTPDKKYYLWQILVQIANFREMGYEQDMHIPIIYFNNKPSDILNKLIASKDLKCHFYLFPDDRKDKTYSASMKPYLMYKYFEKFPERQSDVYNYLDSDVVFTQPMDFTPFMQDDIWYGSDTRSYTGVSYIKSKGEHVFNKMCEICEVDPQKIIDADENSIGAQYFIKNNTAQLWREISDKSVEMYKYFIQEEKVFIGSLKMFNPDSFEYKKGDELQFENRKYVVKKDHISNKDNMPKDNTELYSIVHAIQKWAAEMYATQYIAVKYGYKLKKSDLMQFHWAGHNILEWYHKPFFHDAGQTSKTETGIHFCKQAYNDKSPFKRDIKVEIKSASYKYLELIRRTEQYFPDLVDLFVQHDNGAKVLKPKQPEQININNQILKIVKAEYGNKDVKAIIEKRIADNRIKIKAENALFGDPQPNRKKQLNVVYYLNDKVFNVTVKENEMLVI